MQLVEPETCKRQGIPLLGAQASCPPFRHDRTHPDIVAKLEKGYQANGKTFKVHSDGYNFLPYFKGEVKEGPREEIFYFGQGGELNAIRWNDWKVSFALLNGNIATATRDVPGWPSFSLFFWRSWRFDFPMDLDEYLELCSQTQEVLLEDMKVSERLCPNRL